MKALKCTQNDQIMHITKGCIYDIEGKSCTKDFVITNNYDELISVDLSLFKVGDKEELVAERIKEIKLSMKALIDDDYDIECSHQDADNMLCELLVLLGHKDITNDFYELTRWYA